MNDDHPAAYAARLIDDPEHVHIKDHEVKIEYLLDTGIETKGGKRVLGAVVVPMVQGRLRRLFDQILAEWLDVVGVGVDYLIIIDDDFWRDASDREREALIWHELSHIKQDVDAFGSPKFNQEGKAVMRLVEHDVAAFHSEVERYGAWSPDLATFAEKLQSAK